MMVEEDQVRMTWGRRLREDAVREFGALANAVRWSRAMRWWRRRVAHQVEFRLLAWTEHVDPCSDYSARLLAESEDGDWLVPAEPRNGEPYWEGCWRWYRPDHWPVYLRSRLRGSYVMVERWS